MAISPSLRTLLFIDTIPGTVLVYAPAALAWWFSLRPAGGANRIGAIAYVGGAFMVLLCSGLLAVVGRGTPFPLDPPTRLVVRGAYRHVRNPMYSSILVALLGLALVFGSLLLAGYAVLVFVAQASFAVLYEEPQLRRRFGPQYAHYARNVPRFVPRLRAYEP